MNAMIYGICTSVAFLCGFAVALALYTNKRVNPNPRVRELTYGTITYVKLDSLEQNIFREGDTIWFDRKNHRPDVYLLDATRAVIIK